MVNCDSQAAIRAINSTVIKNSTTLEATMALNTLGESCEAEYDTVPHLLAKCPLLWQLRVEYFDTHYTTVTDIVDRYNLRRIIGYVNRTNRLEF